MPRHLNLWTCEVLDRLADGHWHDLDDVVVAACRFVSPGRAFRHFVGHDRAEQAKGWPTSRQVAARGGGARQIVIGAVRGMVRSGTLERRATVPAARRSGSARRGDRA